ncbi:SRPBCC family protein [Nonomuraea basaltis]|uniref:SRPBCC family protein n=1 Tax=Nonomuraea basaltis TaxID=2495887 RepID=UPI00110C4F9F|nr:hypothetical protein [Nonomuraea basaltis]TMR99738.1 hypothetical protein EJK15_05565 [Nonomuraea basaltis]
MFMARYMTRSMLRFAAGAAAGYLLAVRPWHLRWGADDGEVYGEMAGDDIVHAPQYQATRAVTVDAPPAAVWPWLVEFGGYAPGVTPAATAQPGGTAPPGDTAQEGATQEGAAQEGATTEQQGLKVGDTLHSTPDGSGFVVEQVDPPHTLVLALRGPDATTTCSVSLREIDGRTRMVFRVRIRAQPGLRGTGYLARMDLADFVTMRRQLLTIKERAESTR